MKLPATIPEIVVNLTGIKSAFGDSEASALEYVFRSLFRNLGASQQLVATVVNSNVEFYPVYSVYMAIVNTNPATLLGFGTWAVVGAGTTTISGVTVYVWKRTA